MPALQAAPDSQGSKQAPPILQGVQYTHDGYSAFARRPRPNSASAKQLLCVPHPEEERKTVPVGSVSGGRNGCDMTRLAKWNWIRQAKAVPTLVLFARPGAWPRFSSDPWHWRRFAAGNGANPTPLESLSFTNRNRAESSILEVRRSG